MTQEGETITLSAGPRDEAGEEARRRAAGSSALAAGAYCAGVLMLLTAVAWGAIRANWNILPWWILPIFGVFLLALFALVWQAVYRRKLDAVLGPLRQTTVIAVRPQRLVIETAGPAGSESHDLTRTQIRDIKLLLDLRDGGPGEETASDWIAIFTHDGQLIRILAGRDRGELRWVARLLRHTLGIEPVDAV